MNQECPNCGDGGFRDYMADEFTDGEINVRIAICENRDCRVREFYIPIEEPVNTTSEAEVTE